MTPQTEVAVTSPEREKKEQGALSRVLGWVVATAEDYAALDFFLVGLADLKKEIVADFAEAKEKTKKAKQAATEAHKAVVDQEDGHLSVIEEARRVGKQKLSEYEQEQDRETARLQAIEDEKAETERKRVLALAKIAERKGDDAKAEALRETAYVHAPRLASPVPDRSTVVSTRWSATVGGTRLDGSKTDPLFVLKTLESVGKFLAKSKSADAVVLLELCRQAYTDAKYMTYDTVALWRQATATKDALRLGGVSFNSRKV